MSCQKEHFKHGHGHRHGKGNKIIYITNMINRGGTDAGNPFRIRNDAAGSYPLEYASHPSGYMYPLKNIH